MVVIFLLGKLQALDAEALFEATVFRRGALTARVARTALRTRVQLRFRARLKVVVILVVIMGIMMSLLVTTLVTRAVVAAVVSVRAMSTVCHCLFEKKVRERRASCVFLFFYQRRLLYFFLVNTKKFFCEMRSHHTHTLAQTQDDRPHTNLEW